MEHQDKEADILNRHFDDALIACGHGVKRELQPYRGVRIWEMNCGEVRTELSRQDYFQPAFVKEWIDAAINGKIRGWSEINSKLLESIRTAGK